MTDDVSMGRLDQQAARRSESEKKRKAEFWKWLWRVTTFLAIWTKAKEAVAAVRNSVIPFFKDIWDKWFG